MNLIVNADKNWGIGMDGDLLFPIPDDLKFFKKMTTDHVIVMGRKTLESFPGKKPLKNRVNIVISRNKDYMQDGVIMVYSVEELLETIKDYHDKQIFVVGGAEIYDLLLPYCDIAYITRVNASRPADSFLANLDELPEWELSQKSEDFLHNNITYSFCTYKRHE